MMRVISITMKVKKNTLHLQSFTKRKVGRLNPRIPHFERNSKLIISTRFSSLFITRNFKFHQYVNVPKQEPKT